MKSAQLLGPVVVVVLVENKRYLDRIPRAGIYQVSHLPVEELITLSLFLIHGGVSVGDEALMCVGRGCSSSWPRKNEDEDFIWQPDPAPHCWLMGRCRMWQGLE